MKFAPCLLFFCFISVSCLGVEKIKEAYLISYGDPQAEKKVIQYFSFTCPHCVALFRKDFRLIKSQFIETKKIYWIFQPVPMDLLTVQGMDCLEKLSDKEKKIFLEAVLEELVIDNTQVSSLMMQKAMEIFGKPIPKLLDKEYLSTTNAFKDAFNFITSENELTAVPSVDVNGKFYEGDLPDISFLQQILEPKK